MDILPFASRVIADAPWNTAVFSLQNVIFDTVVKFAGRCSAKTSHKNTLFHTGAHFRVWPIGGQAISNRKKAIFTNEIKDLARLVEAASRQKTSRNQAPRQFTESSTSSALTLESFLNGKKLNQDKSIRLSVGNADVALEQRLNPVVIFSIKMGVC
jgi:hypothetical protein